MKERREVEGRIFNHEQGLGTVTRQMLEERAREIALIDGRSRVNKEDRLQARRDLLKMRGIENEEEGIEEELGSLDPSETRVDSGHKVPTYETDDEEQVQYELVEEGVEEADHEQMLEGHRESAEEEEEQEEIEEAGKEKNREGQRQRSGPGKTSRKRKAS